MAYREAEVRIYINKHFPRASEGEREKIVQDWLVKDGKAEGIANDFERRVRLLNGLKILDAGSGNGGISIAFSNRGAVVEGVDIEKELVDIARAEALSSGSNAHFSYYDGDILPFADSSFDAAISVSVLEHVTDPVHYLSEVLRVLKPCGYLYLAFPNRLYPKETHTGLFGLSYLSLSLSSVYTKLMKRNSVEDYNLHFYTYWALLRMLKISSSHERMWTIQNEKGKSVNPIKHLGKWVLNLLGIPHQALLPHIMLILQASPYDSMSVYNSDA